MDHKDATRRDLVRYGGLTATALMALKMRGCARESHPQNAAPPVLGLTGPTPSPSPQPASAPGKILFVVTGTGGASIMDSFLPVLRRAGAPAALNAYSEAELDLAPTGFRSVKDIAYKIGVPVGPAYSQVDFLRRHGADTAVVTETVTSVNHLIAAQRSLTGNNANRTRTIMEAVAEHYGQGCLFPNVNMAIAGYAYEGRDDTLPAYARSAAVGDATLFAFGTDGVKGVTGAPAAGLVAHARQVREQLEAGSAFSGRFGTAGALQRYLADRAAISKIEAGNLVKKLMLIDQARQGVPLSDYGLASSDEIGRLKDAFPGLGVDSFHSQAALAFLLAKYGISTSITIGMQDQILLEGAGDSTRMQSTPLAFDFSHTNHRGTQNTMWRRLLQVTDSLITLLKTDDYLGDPNNGKIWDRSLMYVATEFGRSKETQGADYQGSGHDMNNGNLIMSPLVRGGRVYGGISPQTGLTYGFDPATGEPDRTRTMNEKHIYSLVAQAMGVDFAGRVDMRGALNQG